MTAISYTTLGPEDVTEHHAAIVAVYREVFTEPPYADTDGQISAFGEDLLVLSRRPGFGCVAAWDGPQMVGFEYATTMTGDRWFGRAVQPPPDFLAGVDRCFIVDWAVLKPWRGQGVGGAMMQRILASRPEAHAVLSVRPDAAAKAIYERAGWRKVGDSAPTAENPRPAQELMYLPLA